MIGRNGPLMTSCSVSHLMDWYKKGTNLDLMPFRISERLLRFIEKMLTLNQEYRSDFLQLNQEISQ